MTDDTYEISTFQEACAKADAEAAAADKKHSGKKDEPTPELTSEVVINLAGLGRCSMRSSSPARRRSIGRRSSCSRRRSRPSGLSGRPRSSSSRTGR